jgi:hypothetical protein
VCMFLPIQYQVTHTECFIFQSENLAVNYCFSFMNCCIKGFLEALSSLKNSEIEITMPVYRCC